MAGDDKLASQPGICAWVEVYRCDDAVFGQQQAGFTGGAMGVAWGPAAAVSAAGKWCGGRGAASTSTGARPPRLVPGTLVGLEPWVELRELGPDGIEHAGIGPASIPRVDGRRRPELRRKMVPGCACDEAKSYSLEAAAPADWATAGALAGPEGLKDWFDGGPGQV